ncbi:MAG: phosphopantetheine-binding protein [Nitrospirota bacterium]|jgi:acyl carrier protein
MKQNLVTEERAVDAVRDAVAETLSIDRETVGPDSSLINDLEAESLDFLDINYRIEQTFGIKMARHFILEHIEEMFGEGSAIDEDGKLTEKAVELLRIRLGEELPGVTAGTDMDDIPAHITVRSIASGVMDILDTLPEKCGSCGASDWKTDDGARIKCGSCGEGAAFTNGDDLSRQWLERTNEEKKIF